MTSGIEQVELDFVILADWAEVVNGKLYMMGGGWDRKRVGEFPAPTDIRVAVGVLVPWTLTNQEHILTVTLEHEDGTVVEPRAKGTLKMGRPPHATQGQSFRAMIAIYGKWQLPQPGTYCVRAALDNGDSRRAVFHVDKKQ